MTADWSWQESIGRCALPSPLTFWYLKNKRTSEINWKNNQSRLVTVRTKEDLWRIYDYLELASNLSFGCDYSVFRKDSSPDWEDVSNANGGRLMFSVNESQMDDCWRSLLKFLVEEDLPQVNGVVVSKRKKRNRFAVWMTPTAEMEEISHVEKLVKKYVTYEISFEFVRHAFKRILEEDEASETSI